ncbi:protein LDOC1-like [Bombina bombina]|uniref:protein LDOC1-like n=1 Tax=Bombina bombina TaxID=8345 RepID=UPI00235A9376|nr:protein LDOC1-like [Bombina bombina]
MDTDPADLPQFVYSLSQRVDQMGIVLRELEIENQSLRRMIRESIAPKPEAIPEPVVSLPEPFSGNRKLYRQFKTACLLLFSLKPKTYCTERVKVLTVISFLRGEPQVWADASFETNQPILGSLDNFFTQMD